MYVAKVYLLLASVLVPALCFNHWVVTEDGKIEYQVSSLVARLAYTLQRILHVQSRYVIVWLIRICCSCSLVTSSVC